MFLILTQGRQDARNDFFIKISLKAYKLLGQLLIVIYCHLPCGRHLLSSTASLFATRNSHLEFLNP